MTRNILLVIKFTFIYAALSIIVDVVAAAVRFDSRVLFRRRLEISENSSHREDCLTD